MKKNHKKLTKKSRDIESKTKRNTWICLETNLIAFDKKKKITRIQEYYVHFAHTTIYTYFYNFF